MRPSPILVAALTFAAATGLAAQSLDVPIRLPADDGQMAVCGSGE
jgi:hypothetical protein